MDLRSSSQLQVYSHQSCSASIGGGGGGSSENESDKMKGTKMQTLMQFH